MSIVTMGELLIDFVATETGVSVGQASGFMKKAGGAPANVAMAVARLGEPASFIGMVGDDPFGRYLADVLRDHEVNIEGLRFSSQANTMLAFVSLEAGGERDFSFYRNPSADMLLTTRDIDEQHLLSHDVFHFGSISLIDDPVRSATLHAAETMKKHNKMVSFDPNLRLNLWPDVETAVKWIMEGFKVASFVKLNDDEVRFLHAEKDITRLMRPLTRFIVVTHGADGATLYLPDGQFFEHHGYVVDAVDTTGAGDAFMAGMLVTLLRQMREHSNSLYFEQMLPLANAMGALTTTKYGATETLPTYDEAQQFLMKNHVPLDD